MGAVVSGVEIENTLLLLPPPYARSQRVRREQWPAQMPCLPLKATLSRCRPPVHRRSTTRPFAEMCARARDCNSARQAWPATFDTILDTSNQIARTTGQPCFDAPVRSRSRLHALYIDSSVNRSVIDHRSWVCLAIWGEVNALTGPCGQELIIWEVINRCQFDLVLALGVIGNLGSRWLGNWWLRKANLSKETRMMNYYTHGLFFFWTRRKTRHHYIKEKIKTHAKSCSGLSFFCNMRRD